MESLVSFSLEILFILCLRSLCGCGECRYREKPIGDRLLPRQIPLSLTNPSGDKSETGSASDTYRPCSLHNLVIAVKTSCLLFLYRNAAQSDGWARGGRRRITNGGKLTERKRNFSFPLSRPLDAISKREEIITCIRSTNIRRSRAVRCENTKASSAWSRRHKVSRPLLAKFGEEEFASRHR